MPSSISTADAYFIQEIAKLSRTSDGSLDVRKFKADTCAFLNRDTAETAPRQHPIHSELASERSPLLAQFFEEEFEKLSRRGRSLEKKETPPVLAKTVLRDSSIGHYVAGLKKVEPKERANDQSFLLYTSEAYLYFERNQ